MSKTVRDPRMPPRQRKATLRIDDEPQDDVALSPLAGTRFEVLREIGRGGMGTVYLARHRELGRRFAIKLLLPELSVNPELVERLRREAQTASQIRHPGIVDVTDFGHTDQGRVFVVMEYLEGEDLATRLEASGPLEQTQALEIGVKVCDALEAAHRHGVIHRDIKPENIFLVENRNEAESVKVVDFGLALSQSQGQRLTRHGAAYGTPEYMAPEQVSGKPVDATTDVYALGAVLYEMLSGSVPFEEETAVETMAIKLHKWPEPPSERDLSAEIHSLVEEAVLKALSPKKEDRFASMSDMGRALESAAAAIEQETRQPAQMPRRPAATTAVLPVLEASGPRAHKNDRSRKLPKVLVATGAGAALAVAGLWFFLPGDGSTAFVHSGGEGPPTAPATTNDGGQLLDASEADSLVVLSDASEAEPAHGRLENPPPTQSKRARAQEQLALGQKLLRQRQLHEAKRAFEHALRLNPGSGAAHGGLGTIAFEQNDHGRAARHLSRAVRSSPRNRRLRLLLGSAYLRLGKRADAIAEWQKVLDQDPDNQAALRSLKAAGARGQ